MTNAWLEYVLERNEEVLASFESVLKKPNTWWYPYNDLGLAYDKLGKYEVAVENYNAALRLEGNNADRGLQILSESDLKINTAKGLTEAAQKVVGLAG